MILGIPVFNVELVQQSKELANNIHISSKEKLGKVTGQISTDCACLSLFGTEIVDKMPFFLEIHLPFPLLTADCNKSCNMNVFYVKYASYYLAHVLNVSLL